MDRPHSGRIPYVLAPFVSPNFNALIILRVTVSWVINANSGCNSPVAYDTQFTAPGPGGTGCYNAHSQFYAPSQPCCYTLRLIKARCLDAAVGSVLLGRPAP